MATRLKIDLSQGILEVEGSETFVKNIYTDFKAHFVEKDASDEILASMTKPTKARTTPKRKTAKSKIIKSTTKPTPPVIETPPPAIQESKVAADQEPQVLPEPEPKSKPNRLTLPAYIYVEELDLGSTSEHVSLVEFMDSKLPITNEERNLVFLYYLQQILKAEAISADHIYTCYKKVNIRAPLNIENSLRVTANQKGWLNSPDNGQITITPEGKLYVEKQLPKKVKN